MARWCRFPVALSLCICGQRIYSIMVERIDDFQEVSLLGGMRVCVRMSIVRMIMRMRMRMTRVVMSGMRCHLRLLHGQSQERKSQPALGRPRPKLAWPVSKPVLSLSALLFLGTMCGRFALAADPENIRRATRAARFEDPARFRRSWNVGPTRCEPVLIARRVEGASPSSAGPSGTSSSDAPAFERVLKPMRWGLIPSWSKDWPDFATSRNTINARDDTVASGKGMWSSMRDKKRCVVPIEAFYEWQKPNENDDKIKIPHCVKPGTKEEEDLPLLLCAGLYDVARLPDPDDASNTVDVWSFTIITTNSSKQLAFLHDRMPVILEPKSVDLWLSQLPFAKVKHLLRAKEGLEVYPVTSFVSKIGQDTEECMRPATADEVRLMHLGKKALGTEKGLQSVTSFFGKKESKSEREGSAEPASKALDAKEDKGKKRAIEEALDDAEPTSAGPKPSLLEPTKGKEEHVKAESSAPTTPAAKKAKTSKSTPKAKDVKSPDPKQKSLTSFFSKK